jgi:hypothetical protein|tara:strand:+ start:151 stop:972 length:822 start_codon:yes stop_codon:yes gene_type:complete
MIRQQQQRKIFEELLNDGKWNKFSIGDSSEEWFESLSDDEYLSSNNIRHVRRSLIRYATEGIYKWNEEKGECDIFPFLGYRSGKLKVTSIYFPKEKFGDITLLNSPTSITTKLRCIVKCDCGNKADYNVGGIKAKKTTHCGCERPEVVSTYLDIVNGKLVTSANKSTNKGGYVTYSINNGEYNGNIFHGPYSGHKLIYEMYNGVTLTSNQNIHHKNGVRDDNHIDNLELWDTSQPAGQRVLEKLSYYFELVKSHSNNPLYKEEIESQLSQLEV